MKMEQVYKYFENEETYDDIFLTLTEEDTEYLKSNNEEICDGTMRNLQRL